MKEYISYFRSEIDSMQGYVPGEQPKGGKIIKLNTTCTKQDGIVVITGLATVKFDG